MRRRTGSFLLLALMFAGWTFGAMALSPALGDEAQGTEPEATAETASRHPAPAYPAPPAGRKQGDFDLSTTNAAEEKIEAALISGKGVDLEFIDTPLADAAQFIAQANGIAIMLDEQALTESGVASDEPLNRTLSGVKLASALKILLEPLELTYVVEDEVLKITTEVAANKKRFTRIYNTGYLKQVGIEPDALKETIQTVIEPGSWTTSGTSMATAAYPAPNPQAKSAKAKPMPQPAISVLGDMVIVSAPQSVHRQINELLIQLDRRWELQQGEK